MGTRKQGILCLRHAVQFTIDVTRSLSEEINSAGSPSDSELMAFEKELYQMLWKLDANV
jgi:hypothetical protein